MRKCKVLAIDWYQEFACIGGSCTNTCCAGWNINLRDEEITKYHALESPFRDEILAAIDEENKRFFLNNHKCQLLDKNGWCKLVLNCGEEALSHTCTMFPRKKRTYGDLTELVVEIACPVVAKNLFRKEPVCFDYNEYPGTIAKEDFDFRRYDSASLCRGFFVDILQEEYSGSYAGKLYLLLSSTMKLQDVFRKEKVDALEVKSILKPIQSVSVREMLYAKILTISTDYNNKAFLIQSIVSFFLDNTWGEFSELFATQEEVDATLSIWLNNIEEFAFALKKQHEYFLEVYSHMIENFLVYSVFLDWIELDYTKDIGERFFVRIVEFSIIQVLFMAKNYSKEIDEDEMSLIISKVDRIMFHSEYFYTKISQFLKSENYMSIEALLSIMLV